MSAAKEGGFAQRFEKSMVELQNSKRLKNISTALTVLGLVLVLTCGILLFKGGFRTLVMFLSPIGAACHLASIPTDKRIKRIYATATTIKEEIEWSEKNLAKVDRIKKNANDTAGKIPATVGFINLAGEQEDLTLLEDAEEMSKVFMNIALGRTEVPSAEILFIYSNIQPSGAFEGSHPANIRQIAKTARASIAIVATPNSVDNIKTAIGGTGERCANLIFTIDRKGTAFQKLFSALFQRMASGEEMLSTWVQLNPQGPRGNPDAPVTLLVAEAGKIAFQAPGSARSHLVE